jgi:hypothetical protein
MKNRVLMVSICTGLLCAAQDRHDTESLANQFILRDLMDGRSHEEEAAARREATYRQRQFVEKMNHFVRVWSQFVTDYNERKVFNIKTAKALSKAFRELECDSGWPKP